MSDPLRRAATAVVALAMLGLAIVGPSPGARASGAVEVVVLRNDDFRFGTYVIDRPGHYRLGEDIVFNPNSLSTLRAEFSSPGPASGAPVSGPPGSGAPVSGPPGSGAPTSGGLPASTGLVAPIDAFQVGMPLASQLTRDADRPFRPGGPLDRRYDPAAYGVGFFAAIAISADDVVLDLDGHTIEQSEEHALLQRFFSVIELADQPFIPAQGPADFGQRIDAAERVTIRNGTIGRSAHHGIHGNANRDITVVDVDFVDYEVAAIALNGVHGLDVARVSAANRHDVPVLGTFSSVQFLKAYVNELVRTGADTTLEVGGRWLRAGDVQADLRRMVNATYADLIARPNIVGGRAVIDPSTHPEEFALFHNPHGVVDGNSYSFLVHSLGIAVDGFAEGSSSDGAARDISFDDVHVVDQRAAITEVPAIDIGGKAAIDPVGSVFQTQNRHPLTGDYLTIAGPTDAPVYRGNPVANAQALVAKAHLEGAFASSRLDVSRLNIPGRVLDWVEGRKTFAQSEIGYLCNGDSMFHVNKGVIGFRIDAADGVRLTDTSVDGLRNLGAAGTQLCDYDPDGYDFSHPLATLPGYGGAISRGYSLASARDVTIEGATVAGLSAVAGPAVGIDVLTDSGQVRLNDVDIRDATAGSPGDRVSSAHAFGVRIGPAADDVLINGLSVRDLYGSAGSTTIADRSGGAALARGVPPG